MDNNLESIAAQYLNAGLCVLPAIAKEKRPPISWKPYQTRLPTPEECTAWFKKYSDALCIITGAVSSNLEIIDFDVASEKFPAWSAKVPADIFAKVVIETTPSGGKHVIYRCQEEVSGNLKLAQRRIPCSGPDEVAIGGKTYTPREDANGWNVIITFIETRGEGGLFLCDPSPGYKFVQGTIVNPPTLTSDERETLLMRAWELNEYTPVPEDVRPASERTPSLPRAEEMRPGDDYNERGDIKALLGAYGWQFVKNSGENECWRRPGKTSGWSATFKGRVFYVFSANAAPFEANKAYSPFNAYVMLEHNGNFTAAAKALRSQGFGNDMLVVPEIDFSKLLAAQKKAAPAVESPSTKIELPKPDTTKDLLDLNVEKIPYAIERILPCRDICLVAGAGGSLKTWLFLEMMRSYSSGKSFLGQFEVNTPGAALLMDKESGRERLALRVRKLSIDPQFPLYFIPRDSISQVHLGRPGFDDWMLSLLDSLDPRPTLVGFDSWTRWFRGNENNASEVAAAMEIIMDICTRADISAVIIDHARKSSPTDRSDSRDKIRGSTDKINAVSTAFWVERREDIYAFEEVKGRDYPPSTGVLGLRFGQNLTNQNLLEFTVEIVPDKPESKIELAKLKVMELVNKNLDSPLTQAEITKKLENFASVNTIKNAISELEGRQFINSVKSEKGSGRSPIIVKLDDPND